MTAVKAEIQKLSKDINSLQVKLWQAKNSKAAKEARRTVRHWCSQGYPGRAGQRNWVRYIRSLRDVYAPMKSEIATLKKRRSGLWAYLRSFKGTK